MTYQIVFAILFLLFSFLNALPIDQKLNNTNTNSATKFTVKEHETITLKCPQLVSTDIETNSNTEDDNLMLFDSNSNDLDDDEFERKRRQNDNSIQIVQWFKDSQRIYKQTVSSRYKLLVNNDLRIKNVNLNDAGIFKCKQINGFGGSVVHSLNLIVEVSNSSVSSPVSTSKATSLKITNEFNTPVFIDKSQQRVYRKQKGSDLKLKCRANATPKPDIIWFKNGDVLSEEEYGITRSKWTLDLKDLRMSDNGNFTCQVFNKYGFINASFEITVYESGETQTFEGVDPLNATIIAGMDAIFTCKIKSSSLPDIKWMKQITKLEYTNYVQQKNVMPVMNTNDDLLKSFYQQLTTQASFLTDASSKDSNLFSINDLLSANANSDDADDDLKLFSLNKNLNSQSKINKQEVAEVTNDESVHYITLTSSPQIDQQTTFNKHENVFISKLIIKQASVKDTGVYVCFGGSTSGDSNSRKSYLKVLPSQFTVNELNNQLNKLIDSNQIVNNNNNKQDESVNYQSIGFLIVVIPVLLVTIFSIISICYLKQINSKGTKKFSIFKSLCNMACCLTRSENANIESEDSFKRNRKSKFSFTSASSMRTSGSENGTTKSSLGSSLSTDSSSTTATTVAYYTTIPLLSENNKCSPPKLPLTQPPSFHASKEENKLIERCTSTPSMAYYKIVDNELMIDPRQTMNTIRQINDDTATCASTNSRLYYQLTPMPVVHHYNFR